MVCMLSGGWIQYIDSMKRSRSRKGRCSAVPLFISKLLEMVQNLEIADVIGWTSGGDSFNIRQVGRFTEEVLPRYFKHRNFSSFIRQLNMYGFRKTRHPEGDNVYMHDHFQRGHKQLLRHITRRMRQERQERLSLQQTGGRAQGGKELVELRSRQKNLEEMCRNIFMQNQKLMQQNQNIIRRMERESREKERRLEEFLVSLAFRALPQQDLALPLSINAPLAITNHPFTQEQPQSDHWRRVRTLLQRIYCDPPQKSPPAPSRPNEPEDDENSYMSINDFINAEEYDNDINLDESR